VGLDNPSTGYYDGKIGFKAGYETWYDGRYVNVRINTGNSLFVFSNYKYTDSGYYSLYWARAQYLGSTSAPSPGITADTTWSVTGGANNLVSPGTQVGMHVNSAGFVDNTSTWRMLRAYSSAWRWWVPYQTINGIPEQEATVEISEYTYDLRTGHWATTYIKPSLGGGCGAINRTP
jgi:hypothetical protein